MPSHIYMRVGRYADSYELNRRAAEADERYMAQNRTQGIYPLNYYPHNLHFMTWSAMVLGRPEVALGTARKIEKKVPPELSSNKNIWSLYETFLSQPMFVMVRFGMWEEMLVEPKPAVDSKYMNGIWHYGRALAYLHTDRMAEARRELRNLTQIREEMAGIKHYIGFGVTEDLLKIAEEIVLGEVKFKEGNTLEALAHLERAVRMEDGLMYSEPPDWYFPVRHMLAAMLMDAGRPKEAEVVYAADLRKNPENGYSLFGLKTALEKQGRMEEAQEVELRFKRAWSGATHQLITSRY